MKVQVGLSLRLLLAALILLAVPAAAVWADDLSGEQIMDKVDENQFIASGRFESTMVIIDRGREIVKELVTYVESDGTVTNALAEFTNPRDRGTKYLMQDNELWMFFPDAEDLVRISDHMLRDSMMGSDFSYQDVLESEQLTQLYVFEFAGKETWENREVYVVEATAREGEEPAYRHRTFWVDAQRFVILREQMFARDGRLLKEMVTKQVEEVQEGRWMPVNMVMEDKLREGSETRYEIKNIDLDYDIPAGTFSLEALQ